MENINKRGISLIVLIITIIVVIILAATVILTLTTNNPISEAKKATFLSDIDTFKNELDLYNASQYASTMGDYDLSTADFSVALGNLYTAIPSLQGKTKYLNHFEVIDGGLAYTGTEEEEITWAKDIAGILTTNAKPEITLTTSNILPVKAGGSVAYTVTMTGTMPITIANLTGNVKVLNSAGTEVATQPSLSVGAVSGTTADKTRSAVVTINTTGMVEGTYKIKLLAEAVQTAGSKSVETISTATFDIDNTAPAMPTITINPTTWTTGDITGIITKSNAADTLEYSTNGTTWNTYTTNLTITSNLTVYARETDTASNVSNVATKVITTIDKTAPTVTFGTNGASGVQIGSTTVTVSDTSGSGVNVCQYIWDTQNATAPASGWTTFTNGATLTRPGPGTFYLWIKSTDVVGNFSNIKSNAFTLISPIYNFAYTGSAQTWTVPYTGTYKLETWGAQGGYSGGNGGYSSGNISLTAGQNINIYVGGQGNSSNSYTGSYNAGGFNGGGNFYVGNSGAYYAGGGGGATDIRIGGNALGNRVIVAGGGGGGGTGPYGTIYSGAGGGVNGIQGYTSSYDASQGYHGRPGTQSAGGIAGTNGSGFTAGTLGQGGQGSSSSYAGNGGGGGYYGAGGSGESMGSSGGSGYIGGVTSGVCTAGNTTIPSTSGSTETGHSGSGYAKITLL